MFFIIIFCLFIVFIGVLSSNGKIKYGLEIAFFFIALFSALRYDYGNDYMTYNELFNNISKFPSFKYIFGLYDSPFSKYDGAEIGWVLLNKFFSPIGFKGMIAFISFFTSYVYYKFIKLYVPQKWYWLALFTYIFDTNLFFVPLSMMRQSLGMVLFIVAFRYISDRKLIKSILLILVASLFHKSALILLPLVFVGFIKGVKGKVVSIGFSVIFLLLMMMQELTSSVVETALSVATFEGYSGYFEEFEAADKFGLGFISRLLTFFIPFLFYYSDSASNSPDKRLLTFMAAMSFLVAPFTLILGFLGRIDYYFSIFNMVAFPLIYDWLSKGPLKYSLVTVYMAYVLFSFYQFFTNPIWVSFTHYQTII